MKKEVEEYIDKNFDQFLKLRKKVHHHPDSDNVHDLRISARRLHTLIKLFDLDPFAKPLKKAVNRLGKLRDLDVSIAQAKEFGLDTGDLKIERKKQRKKVKNFFTKQQQKIIEKIKHHAFVSLKDRPEKDLEGVVQDYKNQMGEWRRVNLGRENFHQFRVALKKARYLLESQGKKVKELVKLQDLLGDIHDLEVLTEKKGTTEAIQKRKLEEFEEAVKLKSRLEREEFLLH